MTSSWFHTHVHTEFSSLDGMSSVATMVGKAKALGQPAIALTDHGNMSATIQGYKAAKKEGIAFFPGVEGYFVHDTQDKKADRYHVGLMARNFAGYQALTRLVTASHERANFQRFPRFDTNHLALLAEDAGDDIILLTGCYFGLVQQTLMEGVQWGDPSGTANGLRGEADAKRVIEMYASMFPHTVVEIQNHNITHPGGETDANIAQWLTDTADVLGLPVMATQDAHYANITQKPAHALMKRMVYGGAESEFPGDAFHLARTSWVEEHFTPYQWAHAEQTAKHLLSLNDLVMPALDTFKFHVPRIVKRPLTHIAGICTKSLEQYFDGGEHKGSTKVYYDRLEYELDVIGDLGIADYMVLVRDVVQWCEANEVLVEARGSANGSLVCYLLGITQVDPIKWGLIFERFLSRDRKKPPDIDLDVEDVSRVKLLAHLASKYETVQIGTFAALGAREEDDKGSILVTYISGKRKEAAISKSISTFAILAQIESIEDVKKYYPEDYVALRALSKISVKKSYGVHAAGVLLSGHEQKIADYVPKMLVASSGTTVTQFDMDDIEELGYLKLDILGQRTLTVMRRCMEMLGKPPRDFSWIPSDDKQTMADLRKGMTDTGVFHFEGRSKAIGARKMKVKNTMDCVLAQSLFMPACMDSGITDSYIEYRLNPSLRGNITYPHPAFEKHLKETFGLVIFQEQVLGIMRDLGLSYEGINTFFKAIKDSGKGATARNVERFAEVKQQWTDICESNGIADADEAWGAIEGYTQYGFNRAHATGYGLRSYRCAYLKTHHQLEFMAAVLESTAGHFKEPLYIKEARRVGIRLLPPDINISGPLWTIDPVKGAIRKGLSSIKGIGYAAAEAIHEHAPYTDIQEVIDKTNARLVTGGKTYQKDGTLNGVLLKLREVGALKSLGLDKE